ncbi:hypothetical protein CJD36_007555 [Flavipsychrobacter stenotrophus]|uniref:ATP-grasp domain-containing protein n=1 Tax=Flavipsychrobacter stenotrophus TaxID=2077091 RepID=A0A2S7SXJ6_9BACT|nr:hypothetical protein [Flavipsychrobacter stenotrophus]PQJ11643.1 hypothetical protein CJD36_007555 [Flavipsychrobacter stenotrophus]
MQYSISFRIKSYFTYILNRFNIKLFIRLITAYRLYKKANASQFKSEDADNIIWLYYPNFKQFKQSITWDILLITYVSLCNEKYTIHRGPDIGKYRNKNILFTIHKDKINLFQVENYSASYQLVTQQLEEQRNTVYPSYNEILYWENKIYMHNMFDKLGIKSPKTTIYSNFEQLIANETTFPFLIKVPHSSGSYGQFNVVDRDYLLTLRNDSIILENSHYLAQERLNITMDMRIVLVAGEIVHYYWRKNKDKSKWKTTSTSHGSVVDFEYFPEQWRQNIVDSFNKLNITMGAFDLGWQNDDLSTEPYIFEVSPSYDINPKITDPDYLSNYGAWKKKLLFKGSFDRLFVEDTHDIKKKGVADFFKHINAQKEQKV